MILPCKHKREPAPFPCFSLTSLSVQIKLPARCKELLQFAIDNDILEDDSIPEDGVVLDNDEYKMLDDLRRGATRVTPDLSPDRREGVSQVPRSPILGARGRESRGQ